MTSSGKNDDLRSDLLTEASLRYDGPMPPRLRDAIRHGGFHRWQACYAAAQSALYDRLARRTTGARAVLRRRQQTDLRQISERLNRLQADLCVFRREGLRWRDRMTDSPPNFDSP